MLGLSVMLELYQAALYTDKTACWVESDQIFVTSYITVTIEYELILETFQTTSEQTMQIFSRILETFIQTVHYLCYDESIQFWKRFKQPVSFSF